MFVNQALSRAASLTVAPEYGTDTNLHNKTNDKLAPSLRMELEQAARVTPFSTQFSAVCGSVSKAPDLSFDPAVWLPRRNSSVLHLQKKSAVIVMDCDDPFKKDPQDSFPSSFYIETT